MNVPNPHQVGIAIAPSLDQGKLDNQFKMIDQEEVLSKAPLTLPDPLTKLVPILGNAFTSLVQARSLLKQSINNPAADANKIDLIVARIDDINKEIIDLATSLHILSLQ